MPATEPAGAAPPPSIGDSVERQLDPRFVPMQQLIGWIVAAAVASASLVVVVIIWAVNRFSLPAALVLLPLWAAVNGSLAWVFHRWPEIEHRHTFYRVDQHGIEIRRGVYWRAVVNVPRSRVQHTDVSQGPIERRFGLGTLVIYTAGTDHARVDLPGLDHGTALRIRAHLLPGHSDDAV